MRKSKTEEVDYEARTMKRKEKLCDYSTVLKEGRGAGNSLCLSQTRERTYLPNSFSGGRINEEEGEEERVKGKGEDQRR